MNISILYAGLASPHVGWVAIDEFAELLAEYFGTEVLSPRPQKSGPVGRFLARGKQSYESLQSRGGDVLIVVAQNPGDLALVSAITQWRKRFSKIYGIITDSYFREGFVRETALYDAITVTAHEDIEYPERRFGIPVHQLYQGADCLRWSPRRQMNREIDITAFGRTPPSYHDALVKRLHHAESPYLYLHSPLGHLTGPEVHSERGMLFKLLQRTSISLAFHMYIEPQGSRPRSMMVTSRWLESLLAGCIVAGKRPLSRMAEEMLFWPGATVELSENPDEAIDELVSLCSRPDELIKQRITNIRHMLKHHDWRLRIKSFCSLTGIPLPDQLVRDISRLEETESSLVDAF